MTQALLLVVALSVGVDWRVVVLVVVALALPAATGLFLAFHVYRNRPEPNMRSASFCQAVARDLRAGSGLRTAIQDAGTVVGAARLTTRISGGDPLAEVSTTLREEFPEIGVELETVVKSAAISGASSAALFEELGDVAMAQLEMAEEIRVATAPARASSMILIGLPSLFLGSQLLNGRFSALLGEPVQQGLAIAGLVLVVIGIAVSLTIARKSS